MPPFSTRNVYYLRVSARTVLHMVLYLDQRHVQWMNENAHILQSVVQEVLRPRVHGKLWQAMLALGKKGANSHVPEDTEVHTTGEFRTVFYFRDLSQGHGVLIKDRSLVFPSGSGLQSVSLSQEEAANKANAPVPERASKRRRTVQPAAAHSEPAPKTVKEERQEPESQVVPESDEEAATPPASAHSERESPPNEDEQKYKPHVRVRYSGLNMFAKELVLVIEPSDRAVAANPDLFVVEDDDASKQERRQLQSTPSAARPWNSVKAEPDEDSATPRQYGRGLRPETPRPDARRSPDPRRSQTPLFRGLTPASEDGYP